MHPAQNGVKIIEVHHQKENLPITEVKGVSILAMENQRNNQSSTTTETQNTRENSEKHVKDDQQEDGEQMEDETEFKTR